MKTVFKNPFAGQGRIRGKRFIGRNEIIQRIENLIFHSEEIPNLAIVGVNYVGKTSLVNKAIWEKKDELINKNIIPIWIYRQKYQSIPVFFSNLVEQCAKEITKGSLVSSNTLLEKIQELADSALETLRSEDSYEDPWDKIRDFFKKVKEAEYGTLFILERFDQAGDIFEKNLAFDFLRDLAGDSEEYGVNFILTSRMSISDIQQQAGSTSKFPGVFQSPHRLGMFSDSDLGIYFDQFSSINIEPGPIKERILFYCGAHPALLNMLGSQIFREFRQNRKINIDVDGTSVDKAANAIIKSFFDYYDDLIDLLTRTELLDKLFQIVRHPTATINENDLETLKGYGLIKPGNKEGTYVTYSEHFHDHLKTLLITSAKSSVAPRGHSYTTNDPGDLTKPIEMRFVKGQQVSFDESRFYEFKDLSESGNPVDSIIKSADIYAVAFLNCEGGRIFWGIDDEGWIHGVKLEKKQRDRVRTTVSTKLSRIVENRGQSETRVELHEILDSSEKPIENLCIVEVVVQTSKNGVFETQNNKVWVREDGHNHELKTTEDKVSFWKRRENVKAD